MNKLENLGERSRIVTLVKRVNTCYGLAFEQDSLEIVKSKWRIRVIFQVNADYLVFLAPSFSKNSSP